ncbi:MAG: esterase [Lachnospiraceae bacterium]|nr:esterase [Lachnospiraceae bacterium]
MGQEKRIAGRTCYLYGDTEACHFLIQPVDAHDLELLDSEVALIRAGAKGKKFALAAFLIEDWNRELSPWEAPPVFGKEGFGAGAEETLRFIVDDLIPDVLGTDLGRNKAGTAERAAERSLYLGGYSLAGLFSLWAAYQTDLFRGVAAVSPSVWFPGWEQYSRSHEVQAQRVYLSLGEKETKTRNPVMAKVGEEIRSQYDLLSGAAVCRDCVLEWNPGNHFVDSDRRTAKGFAWVMDETA